MTAITLHTHDKGLRKYFARLADAYKVEVGVLGATANRQHRSRARKSKSKRRTKAAPRASKRPKKKSFAPTIAQIASWNEFGNGKRNPERPFIRGWFDSTSGRAGVRQLQRALMAQIVRDPAAFSQRKAAQILGVYAVGGIKKYIADGVPPANAQSTIERKGSDKPLIDTGQLRSSITYRLKKARA